MTNKPINPWEQSLPISRDKIAFLIQNHYGFRLPVNSSVHVPHEYKKGGIFMIWIDDSRLGKNRLRQIVNSPYFQYFSVNEGYEGSLAYVALTLKKGFKDQYDALCEKHKEEC